MRHDRIPRTLEDHINDFTRRIDALERAKRTVSSTGGGGSVTSVTAGDSTITVAGTATDPTIAVNEITESQVLSLVSDLATITTALSDKQPLDSELTALAGLVSAANKLPYFTGAGTAALTDLTSFARTLLDDANATTARTTIGAAATSHSHAESDVTSLVADLALKAPLASPVLTGNPTAPTATSGDNDTSIATTAFVQDAVSSSGGGTVTSVTAGDSTITIGGTGTSPTVAVNAIAESQVTSLVSDLAAKQPLDTELTALAGLVSGADKLPYFNGSGTATLADFTSFARTLVDDANATAARTTLGAAATSHTHAESDVTSLVADLALKAPLASPVFTGNPTGPTPSAGDNDTSLATTAFVTTATTTIKHTAAFKVSGTLTAGSGATRLYNDTGLTWTLTSARASVETAPSGGSVIIDLNKNGTTVFTTQANRPTITTTATTSGKVTSIDVTSVADGDYLTVDVDTTTSPAAELTAIVTFTS